MTLRIRLALGEARHRGGSGARRSQPSVQMGAQPDLSRAPGGDLHHVGPNGSADRTALYAGAAPRTAAKSHILNFLRRILPETAPHTCSTCGVMPREQCGVLDRTGECPR